ncbi:Flagellar hook-length control protein FliK [gamma proteobacterium HIMB55]|nr:Flagellar hook-length control protein FliK [gamma proteobacterium HIMB55]
MEELQLTLTPSRVDQRNFGVMLSNWRVGQVLNALVVDRMPSGNVLLNVAGREFVTPLDLPVQAGSRLQLEVQQLQPQVMLKVLTNVRDGTPSQLTQPTTQASQQSLLSSSTAFSVDAKPSPLSSLLVALATPSAQSALRALVSQAPALASLISALSSHTLQANALSGGAISAAISRSGLFNEANLVVDRGSRASSSSKTQLAQLQKLIGELPTTNLNTEARASLSTLSDLTNAALANLTQQQLISMPQDTGSQRWCFGIPLAYEGNLVDLNMVIERDEKNGESSNAEALWRVDLSLTLPEIGPLRVLITMSGREVTVVFNSDSSQVRGLVDSSFGQLKERMILNDFRVTSITAQAMTEVPTAQKDASQSSGGFEVRA